ncbi:MAG: hypothetical protein R3A80_06180 [Bdellovibrionota bacterium]
MKESFNKSFPNIHCAILPFVPEEVLNIRPEKNSAKIFDFLYIASGDAHKNHERLLNAWELLAKQDRFPHLRSLFPKRL